MIDKITYKDLKDKAFNESWDIQKELFQQLYEEKKTGNNPAGFLLFVEHPHVYTLGKSGEESNLLINQLQLQNKKAEFVKIDRGGDITYHGPGQLVGYPIFNLEHFNIGVKEYVNRIENAIIDSVAEFGITGKQLQSASGVWLEDEKQTRKICALGIKVSRGITMHGFALNINTDLNFFNYINPCGFTDKGVTSIGKETGEKVDFDKIKSIVKINFQKHFQTEII